MSEITPRLMLDVQKMEQNIAEMMRFSKEHHVQYRPHTKTHKSIAIAKCQIEAGAIGITVAKVGEAEVMVEGGINNILVAFPITAEEKITRVKSLREQAHIIITLDSIAQGEILASHFTAEDPLYVWMKVNAGLNRVGVEPNEEVTDLVNWLKERPSLRLDGVFAHAGHAYGATTLEEIESIAHREAEVVLKAASLCEESGIKVENISVGATPTFKIAGTVNGVTEIRPGNAVFYDMVQVGLGVARMEQCALTVKARVVSKKHDRLIIDAGSKTLALDRGAHGNDSIKGHGYILEHPELVIERLSEEHGVIPLRGETTLQLNDVITIIPNHACVVANLFDAYTLHRDGKIVGSWPVDARGRLT